LIGLRTGLRVGPRVGLAVGTSADEKGSGADCTCGFAGTATYTTVKRPLTAAQWTCVASGVLEPNYLFNLQEASGNLTDSVSGLVLTAIGAVGYSATVTDWTLSGATSWVTTTTETANQGFYVDKDLATQLGWNAATQSIMVCGYSAVTNSTAERVFFVLSGTTAQSVYFAVTAAGVLRVYNGTASNSVGAVVYENATPTPFAWVMQWDRRGSGLLRLTSKKLGTAAETLSPVTWVTRTDGGKGFNVDVGSVPPVARNNVLAAWVGTDAETMMDRGGTNVGGATLISDLGW
jgi:hypothetical protein